MILEAVFNLLFGLINMVLGLLPKLPNFDSSLLADFNSMLDTIFDNASLLGFFFPIAAAKVYIPLVLLVVNFEHVYNLCLWVITWIKSHN